MTASNILFHIQFPCPQYVRYQSSLELGKLCSCCSAYYNNFHSHHLYSHYYQLGIHLVFHPPHLKNSLVKKIQDLPLIPLEQMRLSYENINLLIERRSI